MINRSRPYKYPAVANQKMHWLDNFAATKSMISPIFASEAASSYLCRVSPELTETHHRPKRSTASTLPLSMESSRT